MEYDKLIEELNNKSHRMSFYPLAKFMESPRAFINYRTKEKSEPTDDMKLGQVYENLVLRDELGDFFIFDDTKKVAELSKKYSNPRNTKKYKEWKAEQLEGRKPSEIISQELYDTADNMRQRLWHHPYWKHYLQDKISETNKEVEWEVHGIKFKGYIDAFGPFVIDLKKVQDAAIRKLRWTINDRQYLIQLAMYGDATGINDGYIVATDAKCEVGIVRENDLSTYINRYHYYVEKFVECCERGAWNQGQEFWTENGYFYNEFQHSNEGLEVLN